MPLQNSRGVAILESLQECGFFQHITVHRTTTFDSHRSKLGLRSTSSNAIHGFTITDTREISNEFNNYFSIIGPKRASESGTDSGAYQRYLIDKRFHLHPTDTSKVLSFTNKLNKSKAPGMDRISARLIRQCADVICVPIYDISNQW